MKRWVRRAVLGLLVLLAIIAVLAGGSWLFISSPPGERLIRGKVVAAVGQALPGKVEIGDLDLAGTTLVLTDVVLRDPEGAVVVRIPRLEATYGLVSLLKKQIDLQRVRVEKPEFYLVQDGSGLNVTRALVKASAEAENPPGKSTRSGFTVRVRDFELEGALIDLQQSTIEAVTPHLRLEAVGIRGDFELDGPEDQLRGRLTIGGQFTAPVQAPLAIAAQLDQGPDALTAELDASAGVKLKGTLSRAGTEKDALVLSTVELPADTLRAFLPGWPLTADATLSGSVARNGNLAQLDLQAHAANANVQVKGGLDVARLRAQGLAVDASGVNFAELVPNGPASDLTLSLRASGGGSSLESLDGQIDLTVPKAVFEQQTLGPIALHATAKDGAFNLSELTAQVPGASVSASGHGSLQEIEVNGKLLANDLGLLGRTLGRIADPAGLPISGSGALTFRLHGAPKHPGVALNGHFAELRYQDNRARGLSVDASLPDVRKPLDADASLKAAGLEVGERHFRNVGADVVTRGRQLTADVKAAGFADVALHLGGRVDADKRGLALDALQLRYPEATWKLQRPSHVTFGEGAVGFEELTLEAGRQRLSVDGGLRDNRLDVRAQLENLDLTRLPKALVPADLNLAGVVGLKAEATGTTSHPIAVANVTLRGGRVTKFDGLSLDLSAKYAKDRVAGELKAVALNSGLSGNFDVPVSGLLEGTREKLAIDLAVPSTSLERLFAALNIDPGVRGFGAATIHVEGTAADPRTRIAIDGDHIQQLNGPPGDLDLIVESTESGTINARIDLDTMGSQNYLLLKTPWTAARFLHGPVTGRMFLEDRVALEGAFHELPLEALKAWGLVDATMKGKASLTVEAKGSVLAPIGTVHLAMKGVSAGSMEPLDAYATISAGEQELKTTLTALRGQQHLTDLEAHVLAPVAALMKGANPEKIQLAVDGDLGPMRLSEIQSLTEVEPPSKDSLRPDGVITGHVFARGTLAGPKAQVHLTADKLGVGKQALGKVDLDYTYDAAVSRVKALLTSATGGKLNLTADTRLDLSSTGLKNGLAWRTAPINVSLRAKDFDPSFLSNVSQMLREIAGRLDADAAANGTLGSPKFRGRVEWQDGRVALMGYGQYKNIHLLLEGTDQAIALSDFSAHSGSGDLKVTARADRKGDLFSVKGDGQFKGFPLILDDQLQALLTGNFKLNGEASESLVTIRELAVPEMHVELPEVRHKDLQDLDRPGDVVLVRKGQPLYPVRKKKEAPPPAEVAVAGDAAASPPAEPRRHYTVLVNAPRNIWIRGSDVNAEIGLSDGFRIEYGDEALLFGEVRFLRGRVDVLGRKFDVLKESQVRFAGPAKLPYINVTAEHANEREQVNVFTTVRGQGKDVTIKVSSTPALSESEIYTLLATGRRTLKRGSGSSMTGAEAASVVGAYAASQLKSVVASKVPLDVLSIEAGSQGLVDASIEAGTYLTDKIYLGSIYRLGADQEKNENAAGFRLEYQITPRWSLETEYGTARTGGADIIWSHDY